MPPIGSVPPQFNPPSGFKAKIKALMDRISGKGAAQTETEGKTVFFDDFKEKATGFIERATGFTRKARGLTLTDLKKIEPTAIAEWLQTNVKKQKSYPLAKIVTIAVCTFFLSDITSIIAGKYIPEPPPARPLTGGQMGRGQYALQDFDVIVMRDLFNSKGKIPGEDTAPSNGVPDLGGAPIKSTLPLTLVGTVILKNEIRSVATIEDKGASRVYPVRVEDEIPSKVKILKIEPYRVVFLNEASGRREYIELPQEALNNPKISLGRRESKSAGIEQVAPTQYNIARSEIDKAFSDLNNILTQARAVPYTENGVPAGYQLFQIVPGSIYEKLGLKNGDVIKGFNGQSITDPAQALSQLGELKQAKHVQITVQRDGKVTENSYDIN